MKKLYFFLMLFTFTASLVAAQSKPEDQSRPQSTRPTSPSVEIVNVSWQGMPRSGDVVDTRGTFIIDVKNSSTKTIILITWEFFLIDKRNAKHIVGRYTFQTKKVIKPGETKTLTERAKYHSHPFFASGASRFLRIEFADGSIWERPPESSSKKGDTIQH